MFIFEFLSISSQKRRSIMEKKDNKKTELKVFRRLYEMGLSDEEILSILLDPKVQTCVKRLFKKYGIE